ncbi:MAG: adenosine kinase [Verrucomicrobiota bacterium]
MSAKKYDVYGLGNALVDILATVEDSALEKLSLAKGSMALMEPTQQSEVLQFLEGQSLKLASGGSAANTLVAVAQSGGAGVYAGKVAHDTHGEFYKKDMEEAGIDFPVPPTPEAGLPTGTSVILTTPDAERTMCTHLGISAQIGKGDVDADLLGQSKISYVEGYLWAGEESRAACIEAFEQSNRLDVKTAFTLSDMFLVDLFADDFRSILKDHCDIAFCNADEAKHFFKNEDIEACAKELGAMCPLAFVTNGGDGCYVMEEGSIKHVDGFEVKAVDTVGAGDSFAGGVLFGLTHGMDPVPAARWGNYFASRVVSRFGARLEESMADKVGEIVS